MAELFTNALVQSIAKKGPGSRKSKLILDEKTVGLYLKVTNPGKASWVYRYRDRSTKRLRDMGLGPYPEIGLALARERATKARLEVLNDDDPIKNRRQRAAQERKQYLRTFREAALETFEALSPQWKNPKHKQQWLNTLRDYVFPAIGEHSVADIEVEDVLGVLKPIWAEKTETATRVRGRIESVLSYSIVHKYRTAPNPAIWKGNLDHVLPPPSKIRKSVSFTSLPYARVSDLWDELSKQDALSARMLELTILTALRTQEVIGLKWTEVDFQKQVIEIPGERMKMGLPYVVPLSREVVALLKRIRSFHLDSKWVFPSPRRKGHLSNNAMLVFRKRIGATDTTIHGLRGTFRDWIREETTISRELGELCLSHETATTVERAYLTGSMIEKRRGVMQSWAEFVVNRKSPKVVPFKAAAF